MKKLRFVALDTRVCHIASVYIYIYIAIARNYILHVPFISFNITWHYIKKCDMTAKPTTPQHTTYNIRYTSVRDCLCALHYVTVGTMCK